MDDQRGAPKTERAQGNTKKGKEHRGPKRGGALLERAEALPESRLRLQELRSFLHLPSFQIKGRAPLAHGGAVLQNISPSVWQERDAIRLLWVADREVFSAT